MRRFPIKPFFLLAGLLALGSGFLLYLSSPGTVGQGWSAWIALIPLLLAIKGLSWRAAAFLGLLAGIVYYLPLLHWITIALGQYGGFDPLLATVVMALLALYMSLYLAAFSALLVTLSTWGRSHHSDLSSSTGSALVEANQRQRSKTAKIRTKIPIRPSILWVAPIIWVALDLIRAWLFTGFPWQDLGYSQYQIPALIQTADLAGHHGITFVIVLVNALLALLLHHFWLRTIAREQGQIGARLGAIMAALLLIFAFLLYGHLRLLQIGDLMAQSPTIRVAVIQGNFPPDKKWDLKNQTTTVERYLKLSAKAATQGPYPPDLIVWPETALPFHPLEHSLFQQVVNFSLLHDTCLLVGAPHREQELDGSFRHYNSALLITPEPTTNEPTTTIPGSINRHLAGIYHKQHLVPFGEYIPLRWLFPFMTPVVETLVDFTPGPQPTILGCRQWRLGTIICFEAIFPRLARQLTAAGADLLVNITNDAWFGRSKAPKQHLSMTVLRAVENRRSLARAANTGISALISPDGRIHQATELFVPDQRQLALPLLLGVGNQGYPQGYPQGYRSVFSAGGYLFGPFCLLLLIAGLIYRFYVRMASRKLQSGPKTRQSPYLKSKRERGGEITRRAWRKK